MTFIDLEGTETITLHSKCETYRAFELRKEMKRLDNSHGGFRTTEGDLVEQRASYIIYCGSWRLLILVVPRVGEPGGAIGASGSGPNSVRSRGADAKFASLVTACMDPQ